jgi:hypothetical protein
MSNARYQFWEVSENSFSDFPGVKGNGKVRNKP